MKDQSTQYSKFVSSPHSITKFGIDFVLKMLPCNILPWNLIQLSLRMPWTTKSFRYSFKSRLCCEYYIVKFFKFSVRFDEALKNNLLFDVFADYHSKLGQEDLGIDQGSQVVLQVGFHLICISDENRNTNRSPIYVTVKIVQSLA